jgi:tRNA(Leu) C34 or U34 (ribose-2'-O)-methylase TrmL
MTIELEGVGRVVQATAFEAVYGGSNPSPSAHSRPRIDVRGFCAVGLVNPKTGPNIGGVMRAVGIYGAALLVIEGDRVKRIPTDTMKAYRHTPVLNASLRDAIPFDCVPVGVDLVPRARSLIDYKHPERAFYIFGPEDSTLGAKHLDWCRDVIYVPTNGCMNLAATVNVVLYDRLAKSESKQRLPCHPKG